jgi:hypothetical protein
MRSSGERTSRLEFSFLIRVVSMLFRLWKHVGCSGCDGGKRGAGVAHFGFLIHSKGLNNLGRTDVGRNLYQSSFLFCNVLISATCLKGVSV